MTMKKKRGRKKDGSGLKNELAYSGLYTLKGRETERRRRKKTSRKRITKREDERSRRKGTVGR